jgi:hypothetical protein
MEGETEGAPAFWQTPTNEACRRAGMKTTGFQASLGPICLFRPIIRILTIFPRTDAIPLGSHQGQLCLLPNTLAIQDGLFPLHPLASTGRLAFTAHFSHPGRL